MQRATSFSNVLYKFQFFCINPAMPMMEFDHVWFSFMSWLAACGLFTLRCICIVEHMSCRVIFEIIRTWQVCMNSYSTKQYLQNKTWKMASELEWNFEWLLTTTGNVTTVKLLVILSAWSSLSLSFAWTRTRPCVWIRGCECETGLLSASAQHLISVKTDRIFQKKNGSGPILDVLDLLLMDSKE